MDGGTKAAGMVEKLYLAKPRGFCAGVVMAIQAVERAAENAELVGQVREHFWQHGTVRSRAASDAVAGEFEEQRFRGTVGTGAPSISTGYAKNYWYHTFRFSCLHRFINKHRMKFKST